MTLTWPVPSARGERALNQSQHLQDVRLPSSEEGKFSPGFGKALWVQKADFPFRLSKQGFGFISAVVVGFDLRKNFESNPTQQVMQPVTTLGCFLSQDTTIDLLFYSTQWPITPWRHQNP